MYQRAHAAGVALLTLTAALPTFGATHDSDDVDLVGRWARGPCYTVAGSGDVLYAGDGAIVRVIDVSTPSLPTEVGNVTITGLVSSLALSGNRLCVAGYEDGLRIVDVSNPAAPAEVGSQATSAVATAVAAEGNYAYVGTSGDGLRIVDITTPGSPFEVSGVALGFIFAVGVEGSLAFAADYRGDLHIIDVTNPASPAVLDVIDVHGTPYGIEASGNHVYTAASGTDIAQMTVVDVSVPTAAVETDRYSILFTTGSGIGLDGSLVYFAAGAGGGVHLIDVSNPADVVLVGQIDTPGVASDVTVLGTHAYVADRHHGVRVLDVSTPATPTEVAAFETPGKTFDVAVSGTYAYLADRADGLRILDVGNPAAPVEVGGLALDGIPIGIAVRDDVAFISVDTHGLDIVDVSTPASPALLATHDVGAGGAAWECVLDGDLAYVAAQSKGLQIVDVSDPTAPVQLGAIVPPSAYALGVDVRHPYAYIASSFAGLYVIDVSDPANPVQVGYLDTYNARDVEVDLSGDYAIVGDAQDGVVAIDVSDPSNPFLAGSLGSIEYGREIDVEGALGFVVTEDTGLRVIDLSNLPTLTEVGYYDTADEAFGLSADGDRIYVADDDDGLWIFENLFLLSVGESPIAGRAVLHGSWPNPFNPRTTIRFSLDRAQRVRLSVHDGEGARIATLLDGACSPGPHDVVWDGRDGRGVEVASGVYVVRLEAGGRTETAKATLLR